MPANDPWATNGAVSIVQISATEWRVYIYDWLHSIWPTDVKAVIQYQRLTMPLKRKIDP